VPPQITDFPSNKEVILTKSQPKIIRCTARSIPPPTIKWLKNGQELTKCQFNCLPKGYSIIACDYQSNMYVNKNCLTILSARHQDEGLYTCVAENNVGSPDRRSVKAVFHCE
jgi:hypothetical protein